MKKAINSTSFEKLKEKEKIDGFSESIPSKKEKNKKIPFFNLGPKNNWKNLFDEDPMSAWISADMQDNKFEYIEAYSFGDEITAFLNGDNSSIDNWKAYARVKRLRMYKLENGEETYICDIYLKDLMGEQSVQGIPLSQDDRGSFIKLA